MGETLPNHAYVDLGLVGTAGDGSDSVQCRTDLITCCNSIWGPDRGDWHPPGSAARLPFSNEVGYIYESRQTQAVDLRRRNNADAPSGIYHCSIETNAVHSEDNTDISTRETVYAGLYGTGGKLTLLLQPH